MPSALSLDLPLNEITRAQFVERFLPRFPRLYQPDHPAFQVRLARRQVWSFLYNFPGKKFYVSGMLLGNPRVIGYVYCDVPYEENLRYCTQMFDTEEEIDLEYLPDESDLFGDPEPDDAHEKEDDTDSYEDLIED